MPKREFAGRCRRRGKRLQQEWTFYALTGQNRFFRPSRPSFNEFVRDFTGLLSEIETENPRWADVEGGCVALLETYLAP